ncbi:MAG: hypothetical protein FJZ64_01520 [Chlamydiae bacterium]|nr:hypothetical protein [Chlamydiota bacterium]
MPLRIKEEFRFARSCYGHLAGITGVKITQALISKGCLQIIDDHFILTKVGETLFQELGIERSSLAHIKTSKLCIDGTERRPHLAGHLGRLLLDCLMDKKWVVRKEQTRILHITPMGKQQLSQYFGIK